MSTIHVNTDLLRQLGQHFSQMNEQVVNQVQPHINNLTSQLEGDWQGQSRYTFDSLYSDWSSSVNRIVQTGEDLGRHLQNTAEQFEQVDRTM